MLILSFISSGLEFSSVNDTSIYENFELKVLNNIKFLVKYLVTDQLTCFYYYYYYYYYYYTNNSAKRVSI